MMTATKWTVLTKRIPGLDSPGLNPECIAFISWISVFDAAQIQILDGV
jgi:hypothetical protein